MADEIHTPLNAIIGFSEMIKMDLYGPIGGSYLTYVEDVHASAVLFLHACWNMENVARASQSP
jgi:signal transduction histidine kinase